MSARLPIPARSAASTRMAASTVCVWTVTSSVLRTPPSASQLRVRNLSGLITFISCFVVSPLKYGISLPTDVEPFLIFANRYYLRKLNLNGSNYTLLIQVRLA